MNVNTLREYLKVIYLNSGTGIRGYRVYQVCGTNGEYGPRYIEKMLMDVS